MKRGFLFGLGSFFVVGVIGGLAGALIGASGLAAMIVAFISMPLGFVVIRAARRAPCHGSRLHAVVGWLVGFFVVDAIIFAAIGAAIVMPLLAQIV